jgi:hypothetical protein
MKRKKKKKEFLVVSKIILYRGSIAARHYDNQPKIPTWLAAPSVHTLRESLMLCPWACITQIIRNQER